jgi:hypothetical protein
LGFYAELRRELFWGILNLGVFCVLGGSPRGVVEEGDLIVSIGCDLGELKALISEVGNFGGYGL